MSITYPLTFPTVIKMNGVAPTLQFVNSNTRSPYTKERQAFRWDGEMWAFQYTTPPCEADVADEWISFAMKLRGSYGTFLIGDKSRITPRGIGSGTPLVKGGSQEGYQLLVDGMGNNLTDWLKKGDYFQLGTGSTSRLYKLVEDADTNASGEATLEFAPKLRVSPADNAALVITSAVGVFCLVENAVTWSVDTDGFYRYSFRAEEAL